MNADEWVPLAEIARPHGVKGEVKLRVFNADSDALLDQDEVLVRLPDGVEHEVSVDRARRADESILMKLHSIDDRDRAEEIRGALVCVRRRDFPELAEGEFYTVDVVGAVVRVAGERLGVVAELLEYPTVYVMVVKVDDGGTNWEIPLIDGYVAPIDPASGFVDVLSLEDLERNPAKKPPEPPRPPRERRHKNPKG